mmetsp:Transcript_46868/g.70818  ORF Transcript_46868/g.70818 Transcript_46868/m.70818 type:complete len:86 (-) Transcript_46868:290-547(-)
MDGFGVTKSCQDMWSDARNKGRWCKVSFDPCCCEETFFSGPTLMPNYVIILSGVYRFFCEVAILKSEQNVVGLVSGEQLGNKTGF